MERLLALDLGDLIGADGTAFRIQARRAVAARRGLRRAGQVAAPSAREVPRADRRRDPPAPPRARPDGQRGDPRGVLARARIVSAVRRYLDDERFVEVETPVLQPLYGGALAQPFVDPLQRARPGHVPADRHRAVPQAVIVGGLERVYEIGKDFRNEGLSPKHNPEFTMVECYEAYADYGDAMRRLEECVRRRPPRSATKATSTSRHRLAPGHVTRRDPRRDRHRHPRAPRSRRPGRGDRRPLRHR